MNRQGPQRQVLAALNAALAAQSAQYAAYFCAAGEEPLFTANAERFPAASLIKVPIALAWAHLERQGLVDPDELCELDGQPQVQGAGFSWLLRMRRLPYRDALLLMLSLSDNLCANLLIEKMGMDRLNEIFAGALGLRQTRLERKLMDLDARAAGRDNWIGAEDAARLFELVTELPAEQRGWLEPMLLANQDTSLLLRDLARDSLEFFHKTGSLPGVAHDWGYTRGRRIFLLTAGWQDEAAVNAAFGEFGRLIA
ncbi:MAG TPA: serine hydrolase [Anaerolineaceae bacterium]